ncbi:hypothetical protein SCHPADRAFT_1000519 [Schizopora paradoxa]|uniref:Pentacotripeptide-repeat region of PRORP domain-containing protein n=1 Tax=Schizopora paradoxa TaxID=27342 RepID=A0A0H2RC70_9AGAM|nr:hypothetical protein SCHPADRAFT_1000519 [Schizopora paradoxa]
MFLRLQTFYRAPLSISRRASTFSLLLRQQHYNQHRSPSLSHGSYFRGRPLSTASQCLLRTSEPPVFLSSNATEVSTKDPVEISQNEVHDSHEIGVEESQPETVEKDDLDEYLERRQGHPSYLKKLHPSVFVRLAALAIKQNLFGVANTIASDVVSVAKMQANEVARLSAHNLPIPSKDYARTATILLQFSCFPPALSDANVLDLCKLALERPASVDLLKRGVEDQSSTIQHPHTLSLDSLSRVLRAVIRSPTGWSIDRQRGFLQSLIKAVSHRIADEVDVEPVRRSFVGVPATPSRRIDTAALSRLTRMFFRFIHAILERGDDSHWGLAYEALEVVVRNNLIPPEAIRVEDKGLAHVPSVIMSPIIHTCLVHGWIFDAADLLQLKASSDVRLKAHYEALVEDVVSALLDSRSAKGIERSAELIRIAYKHFPNFALNSECMEKFYDTTCSCGLRDTGAALYLHLRSRYPAQSADFLPKGHSLLLFLEAFAKARPNQYAAKLLARHVLERRPRIAKHSVPTIIALCAEALLVEESRQLWDYYAQGTDKITVTGNPRVMVALVKLFANEGKKDKTKRPVGTGKSTDVPDGVVSEALQGAGSAAELESLSSRVQSGEQRSRERSEAHAIQNERILFDRENADEANPPDSIANPLNSPEEESVISTEFPFDVNNTISSTEQLDSLSDPSEDYPESSTMEYVDIPFALRVLGEFEAAKEPLRSATHFDLNAIARARALLGDFTGCLNALRIIIDRKEVPDVFDINVVVEALAIHDPRRAALMVKKMLQWNVMPDNVTFGTLINHALNYGNLTLAGRCFARSRSLKIKELTPSAVARLVQASLSAALRPSTGQRSALQYIQRAYDVIVSSQSPRGAFNSKIGEQGVKAALRRNSGELAFKFWDALVKGRVDSASPEQAKLRRQIVAQVRKDCERGALEWNIGHKYVDDLVGDHKSAAVREHDRSSRLLQEPGR